MEYGSADARRGTSSTGMIRPSMVSLYRGFKVKGGDLQILGRVVEGS
jgi:hypothetical protein